MPSVRKSSFLVALALLVVGAPAQQFQLVTGAVPGPSVWSEACESFDADGDGFDDVIVANGTGFSSAGGALAPTLLMNQGSTSTIAFLDQTSSRLPAGFTIQGKAVTTADVDGDGDQDIIFGCGFANMPRLLINDGTGHFSDQTATRLPSVPLNCFGVAAGDLDDDGDLDLVFSDAGPSAFGSPGGTAKLYLNDGNGVFTNASAQLNAVNKIGAQQVNMVDVDGDFDLDVVIDGKSAGQQLYVNDGQAHFTLMAGALPAGSSSTYETDFVDLDNDGDEDAFYISMSGFNEGTARNDSTAGGIAFVGTTATISGLNGADDNEAAFIDIDSDGFLDPIVASLSASNEKVYLNAGTFASASFVYQSQAFASGSDSTLDLCLADFDHDGAYDVFTAQGESGNFLNKVYRNTGSIDTQAPRIAAVSSRGVSTGLTEASTQGFVVRARIYDATSDNGRNFVSAQLHVALQKGASTQTFTLPMKSIGGSMFRAAFMPTPGPEGLVGTLVSCYVEALDPQGNLSVSATESTTICGIEPYGPSSPVNHLSLAGGPAPTIGTMVAITTSGAEANRPGALIASGARAQIPALGGDLLVDIAAPLVFAIGTDAAGTNVTSFLVPATPAVIGLAATLQAIVYEPTQPFGYAFSNGLEVVACDYLYAAPTLGTVSPFIAPAGSLVTVNGSGFRPGLTVDVGGSPCVVQSVSPTQVVFQAPAVSSCGLLLQVTNDDGQSASTTWAQAPLITNQIFPSGPAAGGATTLVVGNYFPPGTTVTIGGVPAMVNTQSQTVISLSTPPGAVGTATVVVTTPYGCQAFGSYTYL